MARLVVLDSGPLGLATRPRGHVAADRARDWMRDLDAVGVTIVVPEIADHEVRRELIRLNATANLRRLDGISNGLPLDPITTPVMRLAAELWALVRREGLPTADPSALDADCILAAQATLVGSPGDSVVIATTNVGHLGRFPGVVAEVWDQISP